MSGRWGVTVTVDGEVVLNIEPDYLSGAVLTPEIASAIREAGAALTGFIGPEDGDYFPVEIECRGCDGPCGMCLVQAAPRRRVRRAGGGW
jgi:hypothetical protein